MYIVWKEMNRLDGEPIDYASRHFVRACVTEDIEFIRKFHTFL